MTEETIRTLLIEDNPGDARLLQEMLNDAALSRIRLTHVARLAPALESLKREHQYQVILLDLLLPDAQGIDTFAQVQAQAPSLPIVLLTGMDDEELAMEAVKLGAQDYLVKGRFDGQAVERSMRYAIERKQVEENLRGQGAHLQDQVQKRNAELFVANEELRHEVEIRRRAEEQMRTTLLEKEVLLHELHDRVRNNLQVIASLLDMQGAHTEDAEARHVLRESQNRVRAMAFAQDLLYQLPDLTTIDLGTYIKDIVRYLVEVYGDRKGNVSVRVEVDDVLLDLDAAVACGLITNELVSNALKHAYPDQESGGIIRVDLHAADQGACTLKVSDQGIGLGKDVDPETPRSLGLGVASMLARQLGGQIQVDRQGGTSFAVAFQVPDRQPSQEVAS